MAADSILSIQHSSHLNWFDATERITAREKEILSLISFGLSTIEIAEHLFISTETVKTHRRNLLQKIGAANCAQLVRKGIEEGLLSLN